MDEIILKHERIYWISNKQDIDPIKNKYLAQYNSWNKTFSSFGENWSKDVDDVFVWAETFLISHCD